MLTVDPARRLANALGLEQFGNVETRVPRRAVRRRRRRAPRRAVGGDARHQAVVGRPGAGRTPPTPQTRDAILANPLYQNITGKFVQSHDYIAMERLYEIHASGRYDLIVVDTPPTRNAIDFLEAPERMADFFSSRLLRWLIAPYRSRLVNAASKPFYSVADRILGSQFLQDIAEFFILFQTMYDGFVERAEAVEPHARGPPHDVRGGVARSRPRRCARPSSSSHALAERELHLGALVLNKVLPSWFVDDGAAEVADRLVRDSTEVAAALARRVPRSAAEGAPEPAALGDPAQVARVLKEIGQSFVDYRIVATREREMAAELVPPSRAGGVGAAPRPRRERPRRADRPRSGTLVGRPQEERWPASPSSPATTPDSPSPRSTTSSAWSRRGACWPTSASPTCCCSPGPTRRRGHPLRRRPEDRPLVVLGQVRPTTSQTLFRSDWVGRILPADRAAARGPVPGVGRDHRGRGHRRRAPRAGAGAVHPGALPGPDRRGAHPGVGAARSAASRASSSAPTSRSSTASPG